MNEFYRLMFAEKPILKIGNRIRQTEQQMTAILKDPELVAHGEYEKLSLERERDLDLIFSGE